MDTVKLEYDDVLPSDLRTEMVIAMMLNDEPIEFAVTANIVEDKVSALIKLNGSSRHIIALILGAVMERPELYPIIKSVTVSYESTVMFNTGFEHLRDRIISYNRQMVEGMKLHGVSMAQLFGEPDPLNVKSPEQ